LLRIINETFVARECETDIHSCPAAEVVQ
jgi:hypothetical protein